MPSFPVSSVPVNGDEPWLGTSCAHLDVRSRISDKVYDSVVFTTVLDERVLVGLQHDWIKILSRQPCPEGVSPTKHALETLLPQFMDNESVASHLRDILRKVPTKQEIPSLLGRIIAKSPLPSSFLPSLIAAHNGANLLVVRLDRDVPWCRARVEYPLYAFPKTWVMLFHNNKAYVCLEIGAADDLHESIKLHHCRVLVAAEARRRQQAQEKARELSATLEQLRAQPIIGTVMQGPPRERFDQTSGVVRLPYGEHDIAWSTTDGRCSVMLVKRNGTDGAVPVQPLPPLALTCVQCLNACLCVASNLCRCERGINPCFKNHRAIVVVVVSFRNS